MHPPSSQSHSSAQASASRRRHAIVLEGLYRLSRSAGVIVAALGAASVLYGVFQVPVLGTYLPGVTMTKVHTAFCLLLLGASLWLFRTAKHPRAARVVAEGLAVIVFAIGVFSLTYQSGLISEEIFLRWSPEGSGAAMSLKTSSTVMLAALSLLLLNHDGDLVRRPAQWLAGTVILSGIWTMLGVFFPMMIFTMTEGGSASSPMAALAFIIFGAGALLARPEVGAMAIFSSGSAAGQMARSILPVGILLLFFVGAVTTLGERSGLYDPILANALFTVGSILLLTSLVWRNAHKIDRTERERERAEEAASRQREWLQVMLSSIADAVIATDQEGRIQFLNRVAHSLTGWSEREAVGRPAEEVLQLVNIKSGQRLECPTVRVLKHGEITGHPEFVTLITRRGNRVPIEDKSAPIRDSDGRLIGCVVVFQDVTERRKADEMRREVARQYATVAEAIPQMVWTAQADGSVDFFNRRWLEYTGLALDKSSGWLWLSAFHEEDRPRCDEAWRHAIAHGSRFEVEGRIRHTDGSSRWHLIRALPVINQQGQISKWFGTCTDIDDQKRAEEAMRFLADASTILSASQDEISTLQRVAELAVPEIADLCTVYLATTDESGAARLQLAAVSHMDPKRVEVMVEIDRRFPPAPEQLRGVTHILRTGTAELASEVDSGWLDAMASGPEHRGRLGELGIHSWMSVPLRGHREILGVVTFVSMESGRRFVHTDLSLAEEVARRTTLALENNRLLAEITDTKVEAEAANAAKDQFLAVLSHELRTPLTPVLLAVEEMAQERHLSPEVRHVIEMTRRNIGLEARLIDDLLDLTRIQRGKLQLQRVVIDAHDLLRSSIEICNGDIESKQLCIILELKAARHHVHGDPARLQQVFWNLIKNSVKFTGTGGTIVFRSVNEADDRIRIEVEDNGIGIHPEMLTKIFNAFEQGEKSRGRRFGGLGLGLAITKNLVEAHGGEIMAESEGTDRGARFTISLRTKEPAQIPRRSAENPRSHVSQGLRILLVEDNEDTGALLRRILVRRGYEVELATSVGAALQCARATPFDLVISDIGLPDGSGLQLMEKLNRMRPIPGIAMSGFGMDDDIRRSREAGFFEHLIKPVSIAKLEEALEKLAAARSQEQA